ncbi:myeloid differentiation primary response protein MyD88 [Prorops nasuta]|uniref:myeloid differentiation primary response protein MyD88 n=1 Tax=Prorops nasuta TaxID=863751 RepID=UPI0034CDF492
MADLSTVPLSALSDESKNIISTFLNPIRIFPNRNGLPRDWNGLAHLSGIGGELLPFLATNPDPSRYIINHLIHNSKKLTLHFLYTIFDELDRPDIWEDVEEVIKKDAERYLEQQNGQEHIASPTINLRDDHILTADYLHLYSNGKEQQYYNAFLLYCDEDAGYANEVVKNLEGLHGLKLFLKDRDLIGGVTFEHEAVMTMIAEHCHRLIAIITPNFLAKSPANKFFMNFAQALGIQNQQRKIIPCIFEKCQLPLQLSYMFMLDYTRRDLYDFWSRLKDSVIPNSIKSDCDNLVKEPVELKKKENDSLENDIIKRLENLPFDNTSLPKCRSKKGRKLFDWTKNKKKLIKQ